MSSRAELEARLKFRREALDNARTAYLEILKGQAQSYTIGSRNITKHNISELWDIITDLEKEVDGMEAALNGGKRRKAVGVVMRDW